MGNGAKKFMYVNRRAPYGTIYALEGLEGAEHHRQALRCDGARLRRERVHAPVAVGVPEQLAIVAGQQRGDGLVAQARVLVETRVPGEGDQGRRVAHGCGEGIRRCGPTR